MRGMKQHAQLGLRQVGLLALLGLTVLGSTRSEAAVRRALLSVDGLNVAPADSIYEFRIETWGVEFLATCTLPQSWEIASEKFEDSAGYLSGKADLHGSRLSRLPDTYLVDVYNYQPTSLKLSNGEVPASFKGWARVGRREPLGDWRGYKVRLSAQNFRLKDATACPTPPPAAP